MGNRNRYKEFERTMTTALLGGVFLFLAYLIAAGAGIVWLKVIFAVLALLLSALGLAVLYRSKELLRSRSLWLSCGFFAVFMCTTASLILNYP